MTTFFNFIYKRLVAISLIMILLMSCSNEIIKEKEDASSPAKISTETLEKRYRKLWNSVEEGRTLPNFIAHIGASSLSKTSIWVLVNDESILREENNWILECNEQQLSVTQEIFDPKFNVFKLAIIRDKEIDKGICTLSISNIPSPIKLKLPTINSNSSKFSFSAYSCNETFSTKNGGVLVRDISLWKRLETRAHGENSYNDTVPYSPSFILGVGDQVYVDPDPDEEEPIAFFRGKISDDWLINKDEQSIYDAFEIMYRYNFSVPSTSNALSKIESKMMWDDHEIRDGWGSQGDEGSEIWQRYFKIARHAFIAYQLLRSYPPNALTQEEYDELVNNTESLHQTFNHGTRSHFLMLDSRSKRKLGEPLFDKSSALAVDNWLKQGNDTEGDLFVLTVGTPLFASRRIEDPEVLGREIDTELNDDFIDAWGSSENKHARSLLLEKLKTHFTNNKNDRLLVISGDVHFSSLFLISIDGRVIGEEVVTSGIAHALPEPAMVANLINEAAADIEGFGVTPAGKINNSATFAEFIIDETTSNDTPLVNLIFHANGTKVNDSPSWVIGNTNLINPNNAKTVWYYPYLYDFDRTRDHLDNIPLNVTPAGTIVELPFHDLPELKISTKEKILTFLIPGRKPTILSAMQAQSIYCTVACVDYEKAHADSWDLEELSNSCSPLTSKKKTSGTSEKFVSKNIANLKQ